MDSLSSLLPEPSDWIDAGLVIDTGAFGSWDTVMEGITPSAVVRRDGRFFLYYVGASDYISDLNNIGPAHRSIGAALSLDGVRWTKAPLNPLIAFSATGNPEEGAVSVGMAVDSDGTLLAYYGANVALDPNASLVNADVHLATSQDGLLFHPLVKVIDHEDRSVWGYGDEIHATLALQHANRYYVFYVPNGTPQRGRLGYCCGPDVATLSDCGPVLNGSEPISSAGPSSLVQLDSDLFAVFVSNRGMIDVYMVEGDCLSTFGPPVRNYQVGSGAVVTLDETRRTWFMYSGKWTHVELKVAPAGARDLSPPLPPETLSANSTRHDRVELKWSEASDPDTGVLSYNVYRDGGQIGRTLGRALEDSILNELTNYVYEVRPVNLHGIEGSGSTLFFRATADTLAPAIESVSTDGANRVLITFDEPIALGTEAHSPRCSIGDGIEVIDASVTEDARSLILSTTAMEVNRVYTLSVEEIWDSAEAPNRGGGEREFTVSSVGGLIGRWSMDQPNSLGADLSGSGHHALAFGRPGASRGKVLRGLELNGSAYLEIATSRSLEQAMQTGFTISAWVQVAELPPRTDTTDGAYAIFSGPGGLRLEYRSDGAFVAAVGRPRDKVELLSESFDPGIWHHVALVFNAQRGSLSLYVDGMPTARSPLESAAVRYDRRWQSPNYLDYHGRFRIGVNNPRFSLASNYFRGVLDEVRIYRRALSKAEIQTLP